jgi:hypothetical protein
MKNYLLLTFLAFFLCSCHRLFPVNKLYFNLICIEEDSENYYFRGIGFKKRSEHLSLYKAASTCKRDKDFTMFSGKFDPFIFHRQRSNGKTAFFELTVINSNIAQTTVNEQSQAVQMMITKRIKEMENNQDSRFQNTVNNKHNITTTQLGLCQILYQSVNDSKATNLPKGLDHLVMQNLYRSCIIPSQNIIIDFVLSIRTPPGNTKEFDEAYLINKMDEIMKDFVLKDTKEDLYTVFKSL